MNLGPPAAESNHVHQSSGFRSALQGLAHNHVCGLALLQWLMARPESHIAVVSHGGLLWHTLSSFGRQASMAVQQDLHAWWVNLIECEDTEGPQQVQPGSMEGQARLGL